MTKTGKLHKSYWSGLRSILEWGTLGWTYGIHEFLLLKVIYHVHHYVDLKKKNIPPPPPPIMKKNLNLADLALCEHSESANSPLQYNTWRFHYFFSASDKALETWKRYLDRDNSRIVDIFVGQLKSCLKCTTCGYASNTFDPLWQLSLPIKKVTSNFTAVSINMYAEMACRHVVCTSVVLGFASQLVRKLTSKSNKIKTIESNNYEKRKMKTKTFCAAWNAVSQLMMHV